ncbi:MAG: hypothetical protein NC918_06095 [Candidatus Omnitrophica bacterium]|nr:hypothetical protein [Candidatus Omnitrophota bacterium]
MRFKKTQSIFEYILVTLVFATAGFATFFAAMKGTAFDRAGTSQNYYSTNTDIGKIVNRGIPKEELRWPSRFGEYSSEAEDIGDPIKRFIGDEQIAKVDKDAGYTYGKKRVYEYKPLNWSIYRDLKNE